MRAALRNLAPQASTFQKHDILSVTYKIGIEKGSKRKYRLQVHVPIVTIWEKCLPVFRVIQNSWQVVQKLSTP